MGTTVEIKEKYQVMIPEEVRKKIPLKIGEQVEIIAREGEIIIRPILEVPKTQAWFWSNEWQEQIANSIEDLKSKKIKIFNTVQEAKKHFGD